LTCRGIPPPDLDDQLAYPDRRTVPPLGIGGLGNGLLVERMESKFTNPQREHLLDSGHYIAEECGSPQAAAFFGDAPAQGRTPT
jgi:hypothetical protein